MKTDPTDTGSTLVFLNSSECRRLVGDRGIGRVVFDQGRGPVALPVNYSTHANDIVFRTTRESALALVIGTTAGFEVDRIDDDLSAGWSVMINGLASEITDAHERDGLIEIAPEPWASGDRPVLIKIAPTTITGRRITPNESHR